MKQHMVPLAYFIVSIKTNNYHKFDGIMQTKFSIPDESPAVYVTVIVI